MVDLFLSQGINEIAISISHSFREEFDWWRKRYYPELNIKFVEEDEPLGTFGGLWLLKDWLKNSPFFLSNGDELKRIDLKKMAEFHQQKRTLATIALVKVSNPQEYGVVVCEEGIVKEFLEKPLNPPSNFINSGLYLLDPEILNYHSGPSFLMIEKDIFPRLAQEKKLAGYQFEGDWTDCGTWERYEKAIDNWQEI